jgi:hypothetical protein
MGLQQQPNSEQGMLKWESRPLAQKGASFQENQWSPHALSLLGNVKGRNIGQAERE